MDIASQPDSLRRVLIIACEPAKFSRQGSQDFCIPCEIRVGSSAITGAAGLIFNSDFELQDLFTNENPNG
jgi:hypothetical protein